MINTCLNVNKVFIYQVEKYMYDTFGEITQHFIKATLSKENTSVFTLIMFYETGEENHRKYFKVLCCVIYTVIKNYVCIDYLAFKLDSLSKYLLILDTEKNVSTEYWVLEFQIC